MICIVATPHYPKTDRQIHGKLTQPCATFSLLLFVLILYVTNFKTWKSICCKCSRSCNLLLAGNCCFWEFLLAVGVICSYPFWKQFFYTSYNVLMFTWYLCIFLKGTLNLEPRSVVCPAPSALILVTCSNVFFLLPGISWQQTIFLIHLRFLVPWFDGHLWLQRGAVSGLLSCRACFSLRSNPPFCFALM